VSSDCSLHDKQASADGALALVAEAGAAADRSGIAFSTVAVAYLPLARMADYEDNYPLRWQDAAAPSLLKG